MHCYMCGQAQEPGVGRCDRCRTQLRAPETSIVPIALDIYNATCATATSLPDVANMLIAASTGGADSEPSISTSRLNLPPDQLADIADTEANDPSPFDFDALFTAPTQPEPTALTQPEPTAEIDVESAEDDEKPERRSILAFLSSNNGNDRPDILHLFALGLVVVAVLVFVGVKANRNDPHEEIPLAFEDQPGFPTNASRSIPDLTKRLEPVLFDLKANDCSNSPVALAIDRERLIAPSSALEPSQRVAINFNGEKISGQVIGATRSPDLALIILDQRLDIDPIDIPPRAGPLELSAPEAVVYTNGKLRFVEATGPQAGWAGPDQGLKLDAEVAHGTFAFLPSGRLVGMVSKRPGGRSVVESKAAIDDSLDRILRGGGDDFGCEKKLEATQGSMYGETAWGRDEMTRPTNRVLEPLADRCVDGDWASCDRLRHVAVFSSDYLRLARSCAGRLPPEEQGLGCSVKLGIFKTRDIAEPFPGACLVLPRGDRQRAVLSNCFDPHDAEVVSVGTTAADCMPEARAANKELYWDRALSVGSAQTPKNDVFACFLYDPGYVLTAALPSV